MLKIKDNVDLKELEKFGFKKDSPSWYGIILRDNTEETMGISVSLFARPRCIQFGYRTNSECRLGSFTYDLDVLFDLIQAGLVEKVGVKDE